MISVFGATGFIGSRFCDMYPMDVSRISRNCTTSYPRDILYLISTTHNYNPLHKDVSTNLLHLSHVLQYLNPDHTFNFISSWFVYHPNVPLPAREFQSGIPPAGNYSMTKWLAEKLVVTFCTRETVPFRIFRLANVFGKGDNYSKRKNALQYLINELRHNRPIELYYGGDFIRDYIHVDDVCEALYKGMDVLPLNDVYNIGSGIPLKFKDLIGIAKEVLGSTSEITSIEPPDFHKEVSTKDFYMDTTKVKNYGICTNLSPYEKLVRTILDE